MSDRRGIIAWFIRNPVAANLVMLTIVALGAWAALFRVRLEVFPDLDQNLISVGVSYPGAAPEEVEEAICLRIEEQVAGLTGVRHVRSTAVENAGSVVVEALPETDMGKLLDEVKTRIEALDTLPLDAERPVIQEVVLRNQVINVAVAGDVPEATLKELGARVRDELTAIPGITQVELTSARPYEIVIETSEAALRRHGLTFEQVAHAVRRSSLDLPGGSIRTASGEILLRTKGQAYRGRDFEDLVLLTQPDGGRVVLGDVARIVDGFAETDQVSSFDGKPTVLLQVFRIGDQDALDVSAKVHEYVRKAQPTLPEGVSMTAWLDQAKFLRGRLRLLLEDASQGFVLVFVMLALFLRLRLAFWVCVDIPVSFLGAIAVMPWFDVSINMISLFSFIVVLGIVVDDAIVVGENVHRLEQQGIPRRRATLLGARQVAVSVTFGVMTTMAAFLPMLSVPGPQQNIWRVIPIIVIATLVFSLVDSKLVLPMHLAHIRPENPDPRGWARLWRQVQRGCDGLLQAWVRHVQTPLLQAALRARYLTVAVFGAVLALAIGLVGSGAVRFIYFPQVEGDNVVATLVMPVGTPVETTRAAIAHLERAALEVSRDLGQDGVIEHVLASVGDQPYRTLQNRNAGMFGAAFNGAHLGEVNIQLQPAEERTIKAEDILRRWRERAGPIPDAVELTYSAAIFAAGDDIDVKLSAADLTRLELAAGELKAHLHGYDGVVDVTDSFRDGKQEIRLSILPAAEALGLTQMDLARQVRQAYFGEEVQRVQRGRDDVKVYVRYPHADRRTLASLEDMRIRTQDGAEVPLATVARVAWTRGPATVKRTDRGRTVNVMADIDESMAAPAEIVRALETSYLPDLAARHPGLRFEFEGQQQQQAETLESLQQGFLIILFVIFALMAIPLRSYTQPLLVMTAIPFGFVGALGGHILLGYDLSILSMFGLVALAGIVVNDGLVLVEFVNQERTRGATILEAVRHASLTRFRAILLTSGTTFVGLLPLTLNKSVQAQFLIPMGISLSFGAMFATFVSLLLLPCLYLILEDARRGCQRLLGRR